MSTDVLSLQQPAQPAAAPLYGKHRVLKLADAGQATMLPSVHELPGQFSL